MGKEDDKHAVVDTFDFLALPKELQRSILSVALYDDETSTLSLLLSCSSICDLLVPMLYVDVQIASLKQAQAFTRRQRPKATLYTRTFTFTLEGVPGGATRGGRESAPSSPGGSLRQISANGCEYDRLWLASRSASHCVHLEHLTFEMFGNRHSPILTAPEYLADVAHAFSTALSQLRSLRTFAWITPRVNHNFMGFSSAVVDSAFAPMIEGLQAAAVDMTPDGRRVRCPKGSTNRRAHQLRRISLHHCIFPLAAYANESFFSLFAQTHPDDEEWLLFPFVEQIDVRTATNVDPESVAFLALSWQIRLDESLRPFLSVVERFPLEQNPSWNPKITLFNCFVKSIWGPRFSINVVREHIASLINEDRNGNESSEEDSSPSSDNPYIRALEESAETQTKLTNRWKDHIQTLDARQVEELIDRACDRVAIDFVAPPMSFW